MTSTSSAGQPLACSDEYAGRLIDDEGPSEAPHRRRTRHAHASKGDDRRHQPLRTKLVNPSAPPANAAWWRRLYFLIADTANETMVLCCGRRPWGEDWSLHVREAPHRDHVSESRRDGQLSAPGTDWRHATAEEARMIVPAFRRGRRWTMMRLLFLLSLALFAVCLLLGIVLMVLLVVVPRQPPSARGRGQPLAFVWGWQASILHAAGIMSLPAGQNRIPYNPPELSVPPLLRSHWSAFDWSARVVPAESERDARTDGALRLEELRVRLATLTALDAPPPPGAESWLDALASFLGGGAGWSDVLRGRGAGGVDVDAATLASAGLVLRVLRERDGYARARGADASEREAHRPMDDVALLQWRHELSANTRGAARAPANASSASSSAAAATAVRMHLYGASSVLNRRYYYGVRRAERAAPYASTSVWTTKAWYDAVAGSALWDVYGDAGVPDAEATSRADSVRLRMHDLSAARVREVEQYESHGDLLPPRGDARADVPTIFVSLASYRDVQCAPTLVDLFQKAKNAHRVYVGLAEQNRAGDASCMAPLELHEPSACLTPAAASDASDADVARVWGSVFGGGALGGGPAREAVDDARRGVCFYADHVRVRAIDADEAKGPTYGRYMAMLLYRGETLTLVLDSHNRFTPFWDTLATHQYYRYDDPKTVLSHYPTALDLALVSTPNYFWQREIAYLCRAYFLVHLGFVRLDAALVFDPNTHASNNKHNQPFVAAPAGVDPGAGRTSFRLPQPWVAGGFLFTNASIMREVPFDPHLPHIFDGEEVLYSVRLWTHGYNIFSPVANVAYHLYGRAKAPRVFDGDAAVWRTTQSMARDRIRFQLRSRARPGVDALRVPRNSTDLPVVIDADRYGMGKERSVSQWYNYAGVDPVAYNVDGRWCAPHMYADHTVLEKAERRYKEKGREDRGEGTSRSRR